MTKLSVDEKVNGQVEPKIEDKAHKKSKKKVNTLRKIGAKPVILEKGESPGVLSALIPTPITIQSEEVTPDE